LLQIVWAEISLVSTYNQVIASETIDMIQISIHGSQVSLYDQDVSTHFDFCRKNAMLNYPNTNPKQIYR